MFTLLKPRAPSRPLWVTGGLPMTQLTTPTNNPFLPQTRGQSFEQMQKSLRLNNGKLSCRFPESQLPGSGPDVISIYPILLIEVVRFHAWFHCHSTHLHDTRIVIGAESLKLLMRRSPMPQDRLMSAKPALGASCTRHVIGAIHRCIRSGR